MKNLLLLLLLIPTLGFGQNVNIPDAIFKESLVGNSTINTNGDSEIQVSEASAFNGEIYCVGLNISNLTGIEAFAALTTLICSTNNLTSLDVTGCTALTNLFCNFNNLTSLDVSTNTALTDLRCYNNLLTSLDVSGCTALTDLRCFNNQLTSLDVSTCTALTYLYCDNNQLTSLDVSGCTALTTLECYYNQLTSLDLRNGNNNNFQAFYAYDNPNLTCINVDDATWSTVNWPVVSPPLPNFVFDPQQYFSNNCSATTSIQELNTNKKLLKVTDLLGRETKTTNQVLIHIYDDGTIEKKIVFE
jgi:hypothetical protein